MADLRRVTITFYYVQSSEASDSPAGAELTFLGKKPSKKELRAAQEAFDNLNHVLEVTVENDNKLDIMSQKGASHFKDVIIRKAKQLFIVQQTD